MKIGMIGTGAIGLPIAKRIIAHDFDFYFYARRNTVISQLQEFGAQYVGLQEMGEICDVVLLFLNTYAQCLECVNEILPTMREGTVVVGSTISPYEMCDLLNICRQGGVEAVAAPVTGGVKGGEEGTLTIITSGSHALVNKLEPLFSSFGKRIVYAGTDIRAAHTMKLLVQLLVGINTAAMCEVLTLGVKNGLDPNLIYSTVCSSAGTTRIFENRGGTVIARNYERRGTVDILCKDLGYCVEMGNRSNCPIPIGQLCSNIFQMGGHMLNDTTQDFSAIIQLYEKWSGTVVEEAKE